MAKKRLLFIFFLLILISAYLVPNMLAHYKKEEPDLQRVNNITVSSNKEKVDLIILKIAHYFPESHPQHIALVQKFIPLVEEGSNWKIRVEVYPNSQLGGEKEYIQGVRNGTIEMGIGGQSLAELLPGFKVIEFPYLFSSYDEAKRILNSDIGNKATEGLDALGVYSLAWSLNGFRQISTYDKSSKELESQGNNKIATTFSTENAEALKVIGFDAVPTHVEEMSITLKQKAVDGHDNPPLLSYYNGWYETQKYIFITNHIISPTMYLVGEKFWTSLPEEYKVLIKNASKETADYETELLKDAEKDIFNTLKSKGVEMEYPDIAAYKEEIMPLYDKWASNNTMRDLLDEIISEKEKLDNHSN
ncbi:TRAP transporter substrate-binding protein [Petroclostridium sp. X23]|uniref:TRAP transporter substrate-binding protein n=1 Tax=Petroclostridium sp. X23 TaxID=3045146 RepID=UPI0024ADA841|nr:TRAP transporter substrate-binding protein [Petroclostridium sp. X23]WHH59071.1 TRAP transporter substrate-binding protein [Petroclostridium sp. X23]